MTAKLIVGIGNPGKNYESTRHNAGFMVVDRLAKEFRLKFRNSSFTKAEVAHTEDKSLYLVKPLTFVNQSGVAVKKFLDKLEVELQDMLIVADDLSLAFEELRVRPSGSAGGHNGLKSVIEHVGSLDFARLRLGIGHPGTKIDVSDYVLKPFSKEEQKKLNTFIDEAADCALVWVKEGIHQAMNRFNRRKE